MADKKPNNSAALRGSIAASFKSKVFRSGSYSLAAGAIVIALAVIVNLIVAALPQDLTLIDTTENGVFTLTPQTEQIVTALEEDVSLIWVVSDAKEDVYLEQLLKNYEALSPRIKVVKIDPVVSPLRLKELAGEDIDTENIEDNSVIVKSADTEKLLPCRYDIYTYSDYSTYYQYYYYYGYELLDSFCAEASITSAIGYVTRDDLPVMYLLSGHGEEDISALHNRIEAENIRIMQLSLATEGGVPADCACLMIASPQRDISAAERDMIEDYVNRGGKVLLISTYASHETHPNLLGLMADSCGLALREGVVIEGDANNHYAGLPDYLFPPMESHPITDPISSAGFRVMLPGAQSLAVSEALPEGVTVSALLTAGEKAYIQPLETEHSHEDGEAADQIPSEEGETAPEEAIEYGPFTLAAAVTVDNGAGEAGEVVWISSVFLLDTMINEMSSGANMDLFLNSISWLCDHEESVSVRQVTMSEEYLTLSQSAATVFTVLFIFVVPCLFVLEGLVTVIKRRRAK